MIHSYCKWCNEPIRVKGVATCSKECRAEITAKNKTIPKKRCACGENIYGYTKYCTPACAKKHKTNKVKSIGIVKIVKMNCAGCGKEMTANSPLKKNCFRCKLSKKRQRAIDKMISKV